jgi:hypothetical protein
MATDRLFRSDDLRFPQPAPDAASAPGRLPATARIGGSRGTTVVFRLESAEAAREVAAAFGPRDPNGVGAEADAHVERAARTDGSALPGELRTRFESSLGADLSSVRIHTGAESQVAAKAVGARAYTVGQDIHFGAGHYDPGSAGGQYLIAHEVAHTVQQAGVAARRQNKLEVSSPQDSAEREADRAADAMVSGAPTTVSTAPASLARDDDPCMTVNDPSHVASEPDPANGYVDECLSDTTPPPADMTPASLQALNWGAASAVEGDCTTPWNAQPDFFDPGDAQLLADAQAAFAAHWTQVQSTWNTMGPVIQNLEKVTEENAGVLGLIGMPSSETGAQPGVLEKNAMTTGGSFSDTIDQSAPRGTSDDLPIADAKEYAEDGFKSMRTADVEADLADFNSKASAAKAAYEAVKGAKSAYSIGLITQASALEAIHKAEIEKEKKDKEGEAITVERDKAVVMGYIGVAKSMFGALEQFEGAASATSTTTIAGQDVTTRGGAGAGTQALAGGGGITGALMAPVEYVAANAYDKDLFSLQSGIKALESAQAAIDTETARNTYAIAKAQAEQLKAAITTARESAFNAAEARRLALAKVASSVKDSALKHNPKDERGAAAAEALIKAIPALELGVAKTGQIAAIGEPGYTESSGQGAYECQNANDFIVHLGMLRGAKAKYGAQKRSWEGDLARVRKLMSEHL